MHHDIAVGFFGINDPALREKAKARLAEIHAAFCRAVEPYVVINPALDVYLLFYLQAWSRSQQAKSIDLKWLETAYAACLVIAVKHITDETVPLRAFTQQVTMPNTFTLTAFALSVTPSYTAIKTFLNHIDIAQQDALSERFYTAALAMANTQQFEQAHDWLALIPKNSAFAAYTSLPSFYSSILSAIGEKAVTPQGLYCLLQIINYVKNHPELSKRTELMALAEQKRLFLEEQFTIYMDSFFTGSTRIEHLTNRLEHLTDYCVIAKLLFTQHGLDIPDDFREKLQDAWQSYYDTFREDYQTLYDKNGLSCLAALEHCEAILFATPIIDPNALFAYKDYFALPALMPVSSPVVPQLDIATYLNNLNLHQLAKDCSKAKNPMVTAIEKVLIEISRAENSFGDDVKLRAFRNQFHQKIAITLMQMFACNENVKAAATFTALRLIPAIHLVDVFTKIGNPAAHRLFKLLDPELFDDAMYQQLRQIDSAQKFNKPTLFKSRKTEEIHKASTPILTF